MSAGPRRPVVTVQVPAAELQFSACRSHGPGGQNVNMRSTRVAIAWDVRATHALTPEQKDTVLAALAHRITDGVLRVEASDERTQAANRRLATARLQALVNASLNPPPDRLPGLAPQARRPGAVREAIDRSRRAQRLKRTLRRDRSDAGY